MAKANMAKAKARNDGTGAEAVETPAHPHAAVDTAAVAAAPELQACPEPGSEAAETTPAPVQEPGNSLRMAVLAIIARQLTELGAALPPHQREGCSALALLVQQDRSDQGLLFSPERPSKNRQLVEIAAAFMRLGPVLVLTLGAVQVEQVVDEFRAWPGEIEPGVVEAVPGSSPGRYEMGRRVTIATFETLLDRKRLMALIAANPIAAVLVDERFHSDPSGQRWRKVLTELRAWNPDSFLIGALDEENEPPRRDKSSIEPTTPSQYDWAEVAPQTWSTPGSNNVALWILPHDAVGGSFRAFVEDRNNRASVTAGEIHQISEVPEPLDQCVRTADEWLRDNGPPCWLRKAEHWRYEAVTEDQRLKLAKFPDELGVIESCDQPKGRASDLIGRLYAKERLRGIIARAKRIAEDGAPLVDAELPRRSIWP
jgi:hypothetical protein